MTQPTIEQLRAEVRASVLTASDPGYDEARAVHNGMFDKRPQVIVRAEQTADVIGAVNFARDAGLDLSVKGGGHSAPGFGTNDGGVVIDLSLMRHVDVDPAARTARTGGGATWGDFNYATHAFGLATTGGIISTTGVAGLTLGGGIGHLARGYGLTIDNLLSAQVVTADGQVRDRRAPTQNEDLFWALAGRRRQLRRGHVLRVPAAPGERRLRGVVLLRARPGRQPAAFLPGLHQRRPRGVRLFPGLPDRSAAAVHPRGPARRHLLLAVVHWSGPLDQGENAMKPFRDLAPMVAEMVGPMPYPVLNSAFDALFPKGIRAYWKGNFVTELTDAAIDAHLDHGPKVPEVSATMHLYPINGACHRVAADETAFAYRDANFATVILASWSDPSVDAERIQWVRDYYAATAPHSEPGGYINFMDDDDGSRIKDNYKGNYDRLVAIKRTYDPDNLFHLNQNIPPNA